MTDTYLEETQPGGFSIRDQAGTVLLDICEHGGVYDVCVMCHPSTSQLELTPEDLSLLIRALKMRVDNITTHLDRYKDKADKEHLLSVQEHCRRLSYSLRQVKRATKAPA